MKPVNIDFTEVDSLKRIIDAQDKLSPSLARNLEENLIVEWTYNSNAIEGNSLTLAETKIVLEYGLTVHGKPLKDHLEAVDHREAIDLLLDMVSKKAPLSELDIRSLHHLILKGIDDKNAGVYRKEQVFISGARHLPPSFMQVPQLMGELVKDFNGGWKKDHPILRAALLSGEFVRIHPFIDGNGRTSRLLLNLSLMRDGYLPIVIKKEDKPAYIEALDKAHHENDYQDYVLFLAGLEKEKEKWMIAHVFEEEREF